MNKKIIICVVIILIILSLSLCVIFFKGKNQSPVLDDEQNQVEMNEIVFEDGVTKLNISKQVENLKISNFEITKTSSNKSKLEANVLNTSDEIIEASTVEIIVTNENGMKEIIGGSIPSILPNDTATLISVVRKDITSATNIELRIVEE